MQMRMKGFLLAIVTILATAQTLSAINCGANLTNSTGTVTSQDPGKGKNCTYYIISNSTDAQVMLDFWILNLVSDNLTIFAGNDSSSKVVANFTYHQGPEMVISPGNITKVVLTRGSGNMTAQFTFSYNTKNCSHSVSGSQGVITSPIYLSGTGTFNCTYNISVPGDTPILSFPQFNLPNGELDVKYNNATPQTLNGSAQPDDLVFGAGKATINLTLSIHNDSSTQNFTANYQTGNSGCSGAFLAQNGALNVSLPSNTPFATMCYMKFTTTDNSSHVYLNVTAQSQLAGADSLVLYDGGSVFGQQLGSLNQGAPWYVSSGQKMTAVAYLGSQTSRTANVSYNQDKFSQLYALDSKGKPTNPIALKGEDVGGNSVSLQFVASAVNSQIQVALGTGTKLTNTTVAIQDSTGTSLISFGPNMAMFPVRVTDSRALVVISGLNGSDLVNLTAATVTKGNCNQLYTGDSGVVTANYSMSNGTCTAAVTTGQSTLLTFNSLSLCKGQKVSIYAGLSATASKVATLSGTYGTLPQIYFSTGAAPRLTWNGTKSAGCSNQILSANYWPQDPYVACGTLAVNATSGSAQSPNFPNQYPLNMGCSWNFPAQNNSILYLSFKTVELAEKHSVSIKNKTKNLFVLNSTTTSLPNDQLLPNANLSMTFSSAITNGNSLEKTGKGFNLDYKILSCGGFLTNGSANISSPSVTNKSVECIWILQVQPKGAKKSVNVVSINISTKGWVNSSSLDPDHMLKDPITLKSIPVLWSEQKLWDQIYDILHYVLSNHSRPRSDDSYRSHPIWIWGCILIQKNKTKNLFVLNSTTTSLPNDQLLPNANLSMTFSSAITNGNSLEKTGKGFNLDYKILSCGGFLTNGSANISSPSVTNKSVECIWILQVQPKGAKKSVNVVSINISTKGWVNSSSGVLQLYDGGSVRNPVINLNLSNSNITAYSSHNLALVRYTYTIPTDGLNQAAAAPMTFNLTYSTHNCNSSQQCGTGDCMLPGWRCDGKVQCPDGSDELNCNAPVTTTVAPIPPKPHTGNGKKVAGYWIFICLVIGLLLGILVTVLVPKIVRRWRLRSYTNSASNYGTLHEDA